MAVLVTADNRDRHEELLEQAYRFRHDHFVERLGWEQIRRPDRRDYDQFDGPHCVHVIGTREASITHYTRFLPTERPHLQSHLYPEILQGEPAPVGPRVYEWTRGAVDPTKRGERRSADSITGAYYIAGVEACLALGLEGFVSQSHPIFLGRLAEAGWDVRPLALPTTYDGQPIVAFYAGLKPDTLKTARRVFGISEPVLVLDDGRPAAPDPIVPPPNLRP